MSEHGEKYFEGQTARTQIIQMVLKTKWSASRDDSPHSKNMSGAEYPKERFKGQAARTRRI
jgi:hypothetical protein